MFPHCSGIILSGGLNTRFSGKDKSFLRVGKQNILDRIYSVFRNIFDEIILVTTHPMDYIQYDVIIATDLFSKRSSLTGLHTGLYYASNTHSFFTACDTPFLEEKLIQSLIRQIEPGLDALVPETSEGFEPLFAVYSKNCLKPIEQQILRNDLKVTGFFPKVRTKILRENKLREADPDLHSFFNINTPDDLAVAEKIARQLNAGGV